MAFVMKPTGTLKIRSATDSSKSYSIPGVAVNVTDETTAATQVNKLFAVAGRTVQGDKYTELVIKKGVEE